MQTYSRMLENIKFKRNSLKSNANGFSWAVNSEESDQDQAQYFQPPQ